MIGSTKNKGSGSPLSKAAATSPHATTKGNYNINIISCVVLSFKRLQIEREEFVINRCEEWKFFTQRLQERALTDHHSTREYGLRKIRQEHLEDMLSNELTIGQRKLIEEILFEIISFHDREADLLYQQGMKDSVWMLKTLGVLA